MCTVKNINDCISSDTIQQPKRSVDMFSYLLLKRSRGKQLKKIMRP